MRRAALILLLLAGCASSGSKQRVLSVDVLEPRTPHQRPALTGEHLYIVHVENVSGEDVQIGSIRLELAGTSDYELINSAAPIEPIMLGPGESEDFEMFVTIAPVRGTNRASQLFLDSLHVTIGVRVASGDVYFSEIVAITPVVG